METRSHRKPAGAVGESSGSVPGTRPSGISNVEENLWKPGGASTSTLQSGRVSVTHAPSDFYNKLATELCQIYFTDFKNYFTDTLRSKFVLK